MKTSPAEKIRQLKVCIDRVARVAPVLYFVDQTSRYTRRFVRLMKARNRRTRVLARQRSRQFFAQERARTLGWLETKQ